ncbi:uncharacterized protein CMC5_080340 [Chondromyces crocatus]|uniref:Uncharacterized protein n=1 Tax=Chondromyces crocatus TaxID=52 RepID=A0A0K1ET23_CHOCO|nr:uncharacterized protein CMC5_080340 [Chondromyces crocatus]
MEQFHASTRTPPRQRPLDGRTAPHGIFPEACFYPAFA